MCAGIDLPSRGLCDLRIYPTSVSRKTSTAIYSSILLLKVGMYLRGLSSAEHQGADCTVRTKTWDITTDTLISFHYACLCCFIGCLRLIVDRRTGSPGTQFRLRVL
ncbi:hypothetical protein IF1G_04975 [Cordyceps javanica]|uniref:Uncharacterized protein n=1 Tax=Cordyceps javanica TaxID=43265 RepID=A0A545V3W1_9HYPO|nr:hypothetical protein IF1G_04975 [Cordyceps javanica]